MYEVALSLLKKINQLGYEAYIVGGYPRDMYMGIPSTDIDICTSMLPDMIEKNFSIVESHSEYGSFVIEEGQFQFEVTTYRRDHYINNRYPKIEFVDSLKEDLNRRDFTMNTLCVDQNGEYIDLLGARKDMDQRQICMVGDPNIRLKEDPLRIIRALRFASDLNFEIEKSLYKSIIQNKALLSTLSLSRIKKEIMKIHNQKKWNDWTQLLDLSSYLP